MLQNLSEEIRECLRHAEECKRRAKTTLSASAIQDYLDMEQRWLNLARSYEFTEMLSSFTMAKPNSARPDDSPTAEGAEGASAEGGWPGKALVREGGDLGSTEAAGRLEKLKSISSPGR